MMESLNTTAADFQEAWRRLHQRWHETAQVWDDPVRWQFEKESWQPLEAQVTAIQHEMERLAHGIAQAHRSVR